MKFAEGRMGRVFVIRLEDGDIVPNCIEEFALENNIKAAHAVILGGIGGGEVVVGPRKSAQMPPEPMLLPVDGAHELIGLGILAPAPDGRPVLHMHASLGRSGNTLTGCLRPGVKTWLMAEVIIYEIVGTDTTRVRDEKSGFLFLEPG
ncbi:MAG: DNA-binding protein [Dethiobacter sp.]|nr:DNA-binding protein [Dethiobacter sp.]